MSDYLAKYTYRVSWSEDDQEFVGLCSEFPSLSWLDTDQIKALEGIRNVVSEVLVDMQKNGEEIPTPISLQEFSGKFVVRIPPESHRRLFLEAKEQHISLNRLISQKLAV